MEQHHHNFKHTGGGCLLPLAPTYDPKNCCDDDYECKCGEKFRVYSSATGHRYLPESFTSKPMGQIKQMEQETINDEIISQTYQKP